MNIHEISAASPDMNSGETDALRESIREIGQQVPILVWRGRVIDGRKRLAACQALGVEALTQVIPEDSDPGVFAQALNLLRTHYTSSQRAAYAERVANLTPGNVQSQRSTNSYTITLAEAAGRLGVSRVAVATARRIRRTAAPEVVQAVERGEITLHRATVISKRVPKHEQADAVARDIREKQGKRNSSSKIINVAAPGLKRPPRRDVDVVRSRALRTMHECAAGLDQFMDYPIGANADHLQWREWVNETTATLRTFTRKLEASHERSA